jgi:PKD repeat protein
MKIKTTFAVLLLLTASFGVLAQKSVKLAGELPDKSPLLRSSHNPGERIQPEREKTHPFRLNTEYQNLRLPKNADHRMKAEPAANAFKEKLDSLHYQYFDTISGTMYLGGDEYYLYDTKGRNYSYWSTDFNEQFQAVIPESKIDVSYSGNYLSSQTFFNWSAASGKWEPYYRQTYTYDANGNETVHQSYSYDTYAGQWFPNYMDSTRYTISGMIQEVVTYLYEGDWYPSSRTLYSYNGNDNLIRQNSYYWTGDTIPWLDEMETQYSYDQFGRDTTISSRYWDGYQWYDSYKTLKSYDANGNLTLYEQYSWNGEIKVWDPSYKEEYTYDVNNRQTRVIYYSSDWFTTAWYIVDKYDYTYDATGNVLEEAYSTYDTLAKVYIPDWKDLYEYDLSVDIQNVAMPYWFGMEFEGEAGMQFHNKITDYRELTWNPRSLSYETTEIDQVFYSGFYDSPINDASCNADFTWRLDVNDDQLVFFTNTSDSAVTYWYWMFGDGATSTRENPQHLYAKPGTYKVVLTTVDATGFCNNTAVKQIKVGNPACNAVFTYLIDTAKMQVALASQSMGSGIKYYWNFGDGSVDNGQNPVHAYNYPGTYQVSLTISSDLGTCSDRYTATIRTGINICNADFAVYVDSIDNTGYFRAKQVLPGNQYQWMLGDGASGKTPNFFHTFTHSGFYTVVLTVSNELAGCVESRKENLLIGKPAAAGKADFIYLAGDDNKVEFTNQSLGSGLNFYWDFNDGESSEEKDPVHPYILPGYYTVCLTAFNADGSRDTYCEKIFAGTDTRDECEARFEYVLSNEGLQIACMDRSFGNPDNWLWTYDDAWPTNEKDPVWNSAMPAYVRVQQAIMNSATGCRDEVFALVNMGADDRMKAGFAYMVDTSDKKADTYPIDFVGISLGDAGKLKWSFGDGSYDSTTVNPTHIYNFPGLYQACLTITNTSTGDSDTECQQVRVGWPVSLKQVNSLDVGLIAYPNPFSESTRIEIVLAENTSIDLSVYDLMGRKVKTIAAEHRTAGTHSFSLDASELEGGSYYLILDTGNGRAKQLINLIK